jgi:hypothetical protein
MDTTASYSSTRCPTTHSLSKSTISTHHNTAAVFALLTSGVPHRRLHVNIANTIAIRGKGTCGHDVSGWPVSQTLCCVTNKNPRCNRLGEHSVCPPFAGE